MTHPATMFRARPPLGGLILGLARAVLGGDDNDNDCNNDACTDCDDSKSCNDATNAAQCTDYGPGRQQAFDGLIDAPEDCGGCSSGNRRDDGDPWTPLPAVARWWLDPATPTVCSTCLARPCLSWCSAGRRTCG